MVKKIIPSPPPRPRLATTLSLIAIAISVASFVVNYLTSLPSLDAKVQLVEPLGVGSDIHFKVLVDNRGRTTAKQLRPVLAFKFQRTDATFEATYDKNAPALTTSDLPSGGHTDLISTNQMSLAHQHDLDAVLSGSWSLYIYGMLPYHDFLHIGHETHFCGYYRTVAGQDPLKLALCPTYNDTD